MLKLSFQRKSYQYHGINTKTLCHFVKRHAMNLEISLRALQTELPLLRVDTRFGTEKRLAEQ